MQKENEKTRQKEYDTVELKAKNIRMGRKFSQWIKLLVLASLSL
jgi:hypothetical protein